MKILKGALFAMASKGRLTLQVPSYSGTGAPETEEIPDDWVVLLTGSGMAPAVGREGGLLFMTRAGYAANKDRLRKVFEAGPDRTDGVGWKAFEVKAERHFANVDKSLKRKIALLEKKVAELKSIIV